MQAGSNDIVLKTQTYLEQKDAGKVYLQITKYVIKDHIIMHATLFLNLKWLYSLVAKLF